LREKIKFRWIYPDGKQTRQLYDGRNRLEAMERRVTRHAEAEGVHDDLARIIRLNIRRRHLTKEQKVELIVSARKAAGVSDQVEPKLSKRGRKGEGRKPDPLKVVVLSDAKAAGISEATVKRVITKAFYEEASDHPNAPPKLKAKAKRARDRRRLEITPELNNPASWRCGYLTACRVGRADLEHEMKILKAAFAALQALRDKRQADQPTKFERDLKDDSWVDEMLEQELAEWRADADANA
jgi:hypothetical protein